MPDKIEARSSKGSLVAFEITQQPTLWPTTLGRVLSAGFSRRPDEGPVVLTGAGTSAYAALAIADAWPGARAIPTTDLLLQSAAEIQLSVPAFADRGMLISLARSGDSPESVAVVERVTKLFPSVEHLAIVCNAEGRLARTSGVRAICLDSRTNDRSLAMTGSFSNLVLAGLSLIHGEQLAQHLEILCERVTSLLPEWDEAAEEIAQSSTGRIVFLASAMHALAREASLKILELTGGKVVTMPETFLGLRHGPVSFLRADTPVLCFASSDAGKRRYEQDLVQELKAGGQGRLIVIGENASPWQHDRFVKASAFDLPDALRTPFEVPFAQLLAYRLSIHTGIDPDNPSPGGTVTRVVKPFVIHEESASN